MGQKMLLTANERPKTGRWIALCIQHIFAMFSATILVPFLTGLSIPVALFCSGVGTLIYILCTKHKVPIYLGSSFAYISYITTAIGMENGGLGAAMTGLLMVGVIYIAVSCIISIVGTNWINKLLPPIIVGPTIIVIGLGLAATACKNAGFFTPAEGIQDIRPIIISLITMIVTALVAIKGKGFFKIIPFLFGIIAGYISAVILNFVPFFDCKEIIDFTSLSSVIQNPSQWFKIPEFSFLGWADMDLPLGMKMVKINFAASISVIPLAFVTICEHIGDHKVLGQITGEDYITDPGLNRTILGDGIATGVAALLGGPANTSYGENTSVVGMSKVASVWVTGGAAVLAILLSFCNLFTTLISTIPTSVMGGVCLILYGFIAVNGLKTLIEAKVDMNDSRNLIIISVMLVIGLGSATISYGFVSFSGMALSAIIGIILNLVLPKSNVEN